VDSRAVVACSDVAKMLEFVEEALDPIAQRVGDGVMRNEEFTLHGMTAWAPASAVRSRAPYYVLAVSLSAHDPQRNISPHRARLDSAAPTPAWPPIHRKRSSYSPTR
jgi:hypothetical protein